MRRASKRRWCARCLQRSSLPGWPCAHRRRASSTSTRPPLSPPSRTNWTRLVPLPVLIGHDAALRGRYGLGEAPPEIVKSRAGSSAALSEPGDGAGDTAPAERAADAAPGERRERGWGAFREETGIKACLARAMEHARLYMGLDDDDARRVFRALDPAQEGVITLATVQRTARGMQLPPELTADLFFTLAERAGAASIEEGAFLAAHRRARALFEGRLRDSERDAGALLELWEHKVPRPAFQRARVPALQHASCGVAERGEGFFILLIDSRMETGAGQHRVHGAEARGAAGADRRAG